MFKLEFIESGYLMADGGAMFGAIPKRAWSRKYIESADNLCKMSMRCVLAVADNKKILIDLGMGDKHLNLVKYYKPHDLTCISESLKTLGYEPEDITDVVISHLHFDHCGYATKKTSNGEVIPSFPYAKYWLSKKQWENFLNPNLLEKDALFTDNIVPIYEAGLLNLIDKESNIYENFKIRLFNGHTEGQLVVYINTANGIYTLPGDLIPTAAHVPLEWISAYDISAITSLIEKFRFLEDAVINDYTLIYYHDAYHTCSKVTSLNNNFKAVFTQPYNTTLK